MNQAKSNESLANALVEKFVKEATAEDKKRLASEQKRKTKKKTAKVPGSKSSSKTKSARQKVKGTANSFKTLYGHMTVEEFFRNEMPYNEFCYYLDGIIADAQAHIILLEERKRWEAQHRINVLSTFQKMIKANAGNLEYKPKVV